MHPQEPNPKKWLVPCQLVPGVYSFDQENGWERRRDLVRYLDVGLHNQHGWHSAVLTINTLIAEFITQQPLLTAGIWGDMSVCLLCVDGAFLTCMTCTLTHERRSAKQTVWSPTYSDVPITKKKCSAITAVTFDEYFIFHQCVIISVVARTA